MYTEYTVNHFQHMPHFILFTLIMCHISNTGLVVERARNSLCTELLKLPWMKLGAPSKLLLYPATRFTKRIDYSLSQGVSFQQEEGSRSFWKERTEGGTNKNRKSSASKHIPKLMSTE